MKLIELCQYTLKQSLCDSGEYEDQSAEDIVNYLNNNGGNSNGI